MDCILKDATVDRKVLWTRAQVRRPLCVRQIGSDRITARDWRTLAAFSEMRSPNHQMMLKLIYDGALIFSAAIDMGTNVIAISDPAFWRMQMQEYPSTSYSLLNGLHENSKGDIRLPAADWKLTLRKLP